MKTMKSSLLKKLTNNEFKDLISTPVGEHWADAFIRMENLPAPWIGDIADFGLVKPDAMRTYKRGGGYQMGQFGKQEWLPKQFFPHGTQADKERYERVFTPEEMKKRLGRSFADTDVEPYLHYCAKEIIANIDATLPQNEADALRKRVFTVAKTIRKSFLNELANLKRGEQGYKMRWLAKQGRKGKKPSPLMPKDAVGKYLREVKAETQYVDRAAHLYQGLGGNRSPQPKGGEIYSAMSVAFLRSGSITPRPLFGSSEKTEKSDGTKVAVSVVYLSPATRSSRDFPDEWLAYFTLPIAMDEIATKEGFYPKAPRFSSSMGSIGQELQAKYDNAKRLFDAKGWKFYKNNPDPKMKLCHNPNTCPYAGGCAGLCLVDSGQMAAAYEPMAAGYFKTWYFFLYPLFFLRQIIVECFINSYDSYTQKVSFYARLNGTSDIPWERYIDMDGLVDKVNEFLSDWNEEQLEKGGNAGKLAKKRKEEEIPAMGGFYDYNKYPYEDRKFFGDWINGQCPRTYDLTFSISEAIVAIKGTSCAVSALGEDLAFGKGFEHALEWVRQGFRVACVVEQWKYIPLRNMSLRERKLLNRVKKNDPNLTQFEQFFGSILANLEKRNEYAGDNFQIPVQVFSKPTKNVKVKKVQLNQHSLDVFVPKVKDDKYSVNDFNTLARTAINSMDDANRGRNILIIDGDETDFRFNDPKPSIVILKPKGINVISKQRAKTKGKNAVFNDKGEQLGAGIVYNNKPFRDQEGRFNYAFNALNQQFIMTQEIVLAMQQVFLQEVGAQGLQRMLPDTMKALKLKGGVYLDNLLESAVPALDEQSVQFIASEAEMDGVIIADRVPPKLARERFQVETPLWLEVIISKEREPKKNPSNRLRVYTDANEDYYYILRGKSKKAIGINGAVRWYCVETLEEDLDGLGYEIDDDWYVVPK